VSGRPPGEESARDAVSRLVHDLRTPLTLVLGFSDLLVRRGDELTPEQREEYLGRIDNAARDMRSILDAQRP
jgi:signal transduction histidine kinase